MCLPIRYRRGSIMWIPFYLYSIQYIFVGFFFKLHTETNNKTKIIRFEGDRKRKNEKYVVSVKSI